MRVRARYGADPRHVTQEICFCPCQTGLLRSREYRGLSPRHRSLTLIAQRMCFLMPFWTAGRAKPSRLFSSRNHVDDLAPASNDRIQGTGVTHQAEARTWGLTRSAKSARMNGVDRIGLGELAA